MTMTIKSFIITVVSLCFITTSTLAISTLNMNIPLHQIIYKGIASKKITAEVKQIDIKTKPNTTIIPNILKSDIDQLYAYGSFNKITTESIISQNKHILVINFQENPLIKTIAIKNKKSLLKKAVQQEFDKLIGYPFNTVGIKNKITLIKNTLHNKGYRFFEISDVAINKQTQTLTIKILEGIIENIEFEGLSKVKKQYLLREMKQKHGTIFNSQEIRKDRERLLKLGYFNSISAPKLKQGKSANSIIISFSVIEKKKNRVSVGIEQDQEQFYGFLSTSKHNTILETDKINLKSQIKINNETLNINNYSINYTQPWLVNKINLKTGISYYNAEELEILNNSTTYSHRNGTQVSITKPLTYESQITTRLKNEQVNPVSTEDNIDSYSINSLSIIFKHQNIQNKNNPQQGHDFTLSLEKGNSLGIVSLGGISFSKVSSSISKYIKIFKHSVFAFRIQGGLYTPNKENKTTFEDEYFLIGGANSLRGYSEKNHSFSGTKNLLFNFEYRYTFKNQFQAVTFLDYGNAFNDSLRIKNFNTGYGIGFRYITPVGPIRLDVGRGKENIVIHLGLGQMF